MIWQKKADKAGHKRSASANAPLGRIALGTSSGAVVVWDLAASEVQRRLVSDDGAAVTSVAFNSQGSLLYSGSRDKHVVEWSLADGSVARRFRVGGDGASALAVSSSDEVLAVGGSAIRTFDLISGKKSRKLAAGLSSAVHQLRFSPCRRFLLASTVGERFVNAYDLTLADREEPALTFALPSAAADVFMRSEKKKKKAKSVALLVGAVAHTGSLYLWSHSYSTPASKPLRPSSSSTVTGSDDATVSAGVLLAAAAIDAEEQVLVVRGSAVKPIFERVDVLDNDGRELKQELAFAPVSENLLLSGRESASKKQKVAAEAQAQEQTRVPTLAERSGASKSLDVVDASVAGFDDLQGDADADDNELTLAERVEALRERVESDLAAELGRVEAEDADAAQDPREKPDASSLASVLEQALQSKDNAMLEYCLRTRDPKVVGNTIKRVASVKVLELLEILVLKFEKSPGRCARLCPWLRSILLHHTAYLIAQPDLVQNLSSLYQILENRLKVHDQLQKLAGRLSLVIGQIHEASLLSGATAEDGATAGDAPRAKVVYREGMSSQWLC